MKPVFSGAFAGACYLPVLLSDHHFLQDVDLVVDMVSAHLCTDLAQCMVRVLRTLLYHRLWCLMVFRKSRAADNTSNLCTLLCRCSRELHQFLSGSKRGTSV
ncbi:uncharacterized protein BDZ99DRAFT_165491 [Mytilinidion resinicola]|uniref:Uncharacterized protein n=1 Tax=Mytilinidion resinicola TaxID=574789 RepID=A0A6A6Y3S0_9PEZI|nr:uncharacterized protein BDZ99DRAFT_165491 [Mytilinidion resinicola]KAF2803481.1 hypothetical protein BDZ99DRAFT_165491 [Mytilinidion resinicola]